METKDYTKEDNYIRAKKKVEAIKGFYWHLAVFIGMNSFISVSKVASDIAEGIPVFSAIWDMPLFFTWIPWGFGVLIHGLVVFDTFSFVLGKNWQERKIKELLDKETNEIKEFR